MEVAVIVTFLLLVTALVWALHTINQNSRLIAAYKRQFNHQRDELKAAARINKRLRVERETLVELCAKYKYEADRSKPTQFTKEQLTILIQLCHPDKHGGRESANKMTQLLNDMRSRAK